MAEIRGIIVKKQGERAEVKVDKAESELTGLPKYIDCWNPVGAKAGDVVGAEYRDFDQRKAKLVIYGLPVAGILAGVVQRHIASDSGQSQDLNQFQLFQAKRH